MLSSFVFSFHLVSLYINPITHKQSVVINIGSGIEMSVNAFNPKMIKTNALMISKP